MKHENVRNILIERAIKVIASEGLDKTTTKAIVTGTGINEAYIYRHFADKEDLLSKAFDALDEEFIGQTMTHVTAMYMQEFDFEMRCRIFFGAIWKFLLGNREKCLAYIRYYYSPYFQKYSAQSHKKRFAPFLEIFQEVFRDEADVWLILNHILNVMLDFAVKVFNNEMPENDDYAEHIFRVIYASIKQYFKEDKECSFKI